MSPITTHVLNTALGRPAAGVAVTLRRGDLVIGQGSTDGDGRLRDLVTSIEPGDYELEFDTGAYFSGLGLESFYPAVRIAFSIKDAAQHYHVPLLLSPFGYSTYRGS